MASGFGQLETPGIEPRPIEAAGLQTPASVFPLPVTPLEYYYLCDDRPDYPATFTLELTFSGSLQRERLLAALGTALARHPLLAAPIDWNNGGRPNWTCANWPPSIDWADAHVPIAHPEGERIDLTRAVGVRVWVREGREEVRALFQFHHAACDALGACGFLEDLLICYRAQHEEDFADCLRPLNPARLLTRDSFGVVDPNWRPSWGDVIRTIRHWVGLIRRAPEVLAAPRADGLGAREQGFLGFVDFTFGVEESRGLRVAAAAEGVTLNDLVLRDLFLVLAQWNAEHDRHGRMRINLPTSLRSRQDLELPAANVISYAFIDRELGRRADPARLLDSLGQETAAIKRQRPGLLFLGGLGFACGIRGLVPWMLGRRRSFATATLSNLGKLWTRSPLRRGGKLDVGGAVLQRVSGAPPIRPLTRAGFALLDYARQITVTLRCDRTCFSREQSQALLDRFIARLKQSVHDAQGRPVRKPR